MQTQEAAILAYLKSGATLSGLDALNKFGCIHLPGVIHSLRQAGYDIETQNGKAFSRIAGRDKRFAVYKLVSSPAPVNGGQRTFAFNGDGPV